MVKMAVYCMPANSTSPARVCPGRLLSFQLLPELCSLVVTVTCLSRGGSQREHTKPYVLNYFENPATLSPVVVKTAFRMSHPDSQHLGPDNFRLCQRPCYLDCRWLP